MGGARGQSVRRGPVVLIASLIACSTIRGQAPARPDTTSNDPHAAQPERPTVATHAGTVAPGWLEIETGVERDRVSASPSAYVTPTLFKIGIVSHVQLGLFGAYSKPAPGVHGLGDVGASLKWRLADDAPVVGDFALQPSIKFPTGDADEDTGTGTTDFSILAISSHDVGGVAIDINVGYTHRSGNGSTAPTSATVWTLSFGGPAVGRLGWVAELYGFPGTSGPSGQPPIVAFLGGPTVTVKPWLVFDAGFISPIAGHQPNALYAGLVYNVGRLVPGLR
jgi:hypothetical protein